MTTNSNRENEQIREHLSYYVSCGTTLGVEWLGHLLYLLLFAIGSECKFSGRTAMYNLWLPSIQLQTCMIKVQNFMCKASICLALILNSCTELRPFSPKFSPCLIDPMSINYLIFVLFLYWSGNDICKEIQGR